MRRSRVLTIIAASTLTFSVLTGPVGAAEGGDMTAGPVPQLQLRTAQVAQVAAHGPDSITVCSFDSGRSSRPFATSTGRLGYDTLRAALHDGANFGPGGVDPRTVTIRPGVTTLSAANLDGCDVLMAQELAGDLSAAEAEALGDAYETGLLLVIVEADTVGGTAEANSVLAALGRPGGVGFGSNSGDSGSAGGSIAVDAPERAANGAFGDVRGGTFATSPAKSVLKFGALTVQSADGTKVRKSRGRILIGGDPSGIDLFTNPTSGFHNPNNLTMYLNFIASAR